MKSNQAAGSSTLPHASLAKVEDDYKVHSGQGKQDLKDLVLSLRGKLDELAGINERFFQMIHAGEKEEPDSDEPVTKSISLKPPLIDELAEPLLVYRISSLMDFLRQTLDFQDWGVFLLSENNSKIKKVASSESAEDKFSKDFEDEVERRWESGNIEQAISQKRRTVLPAEEGNWLIVPFAIWGDKDSSKLTINGFWVLQFKKGVYTETKTSADLLFGADMITTCLENCYLNKSFFSSPREEPNRVEREKLKTMVELSRAMVHELNNSLQIILGRTQTLRMSLNKSSETTSPTGVLEAIEGNANRICSTLKNFSDFLHRQCEGWANAQEVNFKHIVESNLVLIRYILKLNGIQLEVDTGGDLPSVSGDPGELELAFLSLIRGVKDCLPSGGNLHMRIYQEKESLCLSAHCAGKKSEKDESPNLIAFQNNDQFKLVSQILSKHQGDFELEEPADGEKKLVMRLKIA